MWTLYLFIGIAAVAMISAVIASRFIGQKPLYSMSYEGNGMLPTLQHGSVLTFDPNKKPVRGDIVAYQSPEKEKIIVTRIVGFSGDTITFNRNSLSINNVIYHGSSDATSTTGAFNNLTPDGSPKTVVIAEKQVFMLLDNWTNCIEGCNFSTVPIDSIVGVLVNVVLPDTNAAGQSS